MNDSALCWSYWTSVRLRWNAQAVELLPAKTKR